jgi:hypothetical protein
VPAVGGEHDRGRVGGQGAAGSAMCRTWWSNTPLARPSALAIGPSPNTTTGLIGSAGSRKISSAPPDRHGVETVTEPGAPRPSSGCG